MLTLVFLALYVLYCFFTVNRAKSMVWMCANLAFLAGMGALVVFHQNVYFGLGVVSALANAGYQYFGAKVPLAGNLKTYVKDLISNVLFYPVALFEEAYNKLNSKL